jgi:hypothetical protein
MTALGDSTVKLDQRFCIAINQLGHRPVSLSDQDAYESGSRMQASTSGFRAVVVF